MWSFCSCKLFHYYLQDLYAYLSEHEILVNFTDKNALIWEKRGLVYGDWTSGPNGDGSFTIETVVPASEVFTKQTKLFLLPM